MKKQIAALTLATTLGLSIQPIVSSAEIAQNTAATQQSGWIKGENGAWFFYENGVKKTGWFKYNDNWFYLDGNNGGALKVGWFKYNDNWFYAEESSAVSSKYGALKVGWFKYDD
ncbi:hypothetical protein P9618_26810, partial [Bacillus pseudomycoides]|nr:hypothetical protein [Bacillus pseudomycoides]